MSSSDAVLKLKQAFSRLGTAPTAGEASTDMLEQKAVRRGRKPKPFRTVQLNVRVPQDVKDRARMLAARDRRDVSAIVIEAIELYEAKYGAAPVVAHRRGTS